MFHKRILFIFFFVLMSLLTCHQTITLRRITPDRSDTSISGFTDSVTQWLRGLWS
jgi:hypothetical protein